MAVHATWIRKNMLQSPASDPSHCDRKMSENELRVLRSIQKLSIPDWYLNSSSRPPKILSNATPIDRRPPSWKNISAKESAANERAVARAQASAESRDNAPKIEESSIGNESSGTYRMRRESSTNESNNSQKQDFLPELQNIDAIASKTKNMNISQTFPRTSPSRKIQNINIVFPPSPEKSTGLLITDLDETEKSCMDMTVDSLNAISTRKTTDRHRRARVYHDELFAPDSTAMKIFQTRDDEDKTDEKVTLAENIERRKSSGPRGAPFFVATDIDATPGKENRTPLSISSFPICITPDNGKNRQRIPKTLFPVPFSNPNSKCREKDRRLSISSSMDASMEPSAEEPKTRTPISAPVNSKTSSSSNIAKQLPIQPIAMKTSVAALNGEKCHACKLQSASKQPPTALPRGSTSFRKKHSLPPILEKSSDLVPPTSSTLRSDSSGESFFNSNGKSLELERIVRRKQRSGSQKSFASEIIEELNERCKIPSPTRYVSPHSKNFVKKLVEELETSVVLSSDCANDIQFDPAENFDDCNINNDYNDDFEEEDDDVFIGSENGSEDDVNSVAISTSISCKGTESGSSSDTDPGSSTIKYDYDRYGWTINANEDDSVNGDNNNVQTRNNNHRDIEDGSPIVDDENDNWLYWNKKTEWNLPRTSSLLSVLSKKSSSYVGNTSPCISPIDCPDEPGDFNVSRRLSNNNWGTIYKTKETGNSYKLCRLSETTILDSGYSDRSRGSSRSSSRFDNNNLIWFDCTDGTRNPSRIGSFYKDAWTKDLISTARKLNTTSPMHGRPFVV